MHAEHADSPRLNDLSGRVTGCAFVVLNAHGLDKIYANALAQAPRDADIVAQQQ